MKEHHRVSVEFEAMIEGNGSINIPKEVLAGFKGGRNKVHVRLTSNAVGARLRHRGVSEDEIETISRVQLEPRDQVVKFLMSEGALRGTSGRRSR